MLEVEAVAILGSGAIGGMEGMCSSASLLTGTFSGDWPL